MRNCVGAGSEVAAAIERTLESPNESDRNLEAANVVDGLYAVARALRAISHGGVDGPCGLEGLAMSIAGEGPIGSNSLSHSVDKAGSEIAAALNNVAESLGDIAEQLATRNANATE